MSDKIPRPLTSLIKNQEKMIEILKQQEEILLRNSLTLSSIEGCICNTIQSIFIQLVIDIPIRNKNFSLPLIGPFRDVIIIWGDGETTGPITSNENNVTVITHLYSLFNEYSILVQGGSLNGFGWRNQEPSSYDSLKAVISLSGINTISGILSGAVNAERVPESIPLSVRDISFAFSNASSFNQDISSWNTDNIINMEKTFFGASSFNQNISSWNVENVTNCNEFSTSSPINIRKNFLPDFSRCQCNCGLEEFRLIVNTRLPEASKIVSIPIQGSNKINVEWGDGNIEDLSSFPLTHTYQEDGLYEIVIRAKIFSSFGWGRMEALNSTSLLEIVSWPNVPTLSGAGKGAINLQTVPTSLPSTVTNISFLFEGAASFNQSIESWNTENINNMEGLFKDTVLFNQSLNEWNVSNVENMKGLFEGATSFNSKIDKWNVSNVINMIEMFSGAKSFNQNINNWNVSNVENMSSMFSRASSYNQDMNEWNMSKVKDTSFMFFEATSFNSNIQDWEMSSVTTMTSMFSGAISFNQNIIKWNTSNNLSTVEMFRSTFAFNQPLLSWDVSKVRFMDAMFLDARSFDKNISLWNVENVENCKLFSLFSPINEKDDFLPKFTCECNCGSSII